MIGKVIKYFLIIRGQIFCVYRLISYNNLKSVIHLNYVYFQIISNDYILVKKRFRSGIKTARTRTFRGADVGSDHDMVI